MISSLDQLGVAGQFNKDTQNNLSTLRLQKILKKVEYNSDTPLKLPGKGRYVDANGDLR